MALALAFSLLASMPGSMPVLVPTDYETLALSVSEGDIGYLDIWLLSFSLHSNTNQNGPTLAT